MPSKGERLAKANRAAELLRTEAFKESFGELEERYVDAWKQTAPDEWRRREVVYSQLQALYDLRAQLESAVNDGELAKR